MADSGQVAPLQSTEITRSLRGRLAGGIAGFPRAVRAPHRDSLGGRTETFDAGFWVPSRVARPDDTGGTWFGSVWFPRLARTVRRAISLIAALNVGKPIVRLPQG